MKMKKKMMTVAAVSTATMMFLTGCQAKELSNEYVTVKEYKGVEVAKVEKTDVTDEVVENKINSLLNDYATKEEVTDRAAELGDFVNIDYEGKKDGVAFDGGTAAGFELELGSNRFIEGFETGVVGHQVGETFDLNLTFPEEYQAEELAGQEVVFTVTLNSISVKKVPELTDEFVKTNLSEDAETVKEYKKEVKEDMKEDSEETYEANLRNAVWTAVLEKAEVKKYPEEEIQKYSDMLRSQYESYASMYGVEFAEFLNTYMNGMDEETFNTQVKSAAETQVKSDLVRDLLAENVNIDTSEDAYQEKYEEVAELYGYEETEEFLTQMEAAGNKESLDDLVLLQLVQDWVADHCKQK